MKTILVLTIKLKTDSFNNNELLKMYELLDLLRHSSMYTKSMKAKMTPKYKLSIKELRLDDKDYRSNGVNDIGEKLEDALNVLSCFNNLHNEELDKRNPTYCVLEEIINLLYCHFPHYCIIEDVRDNQHTPLFEVVKLNTYLNQ